MGLTDTQLGYLIIGIGILFVLGLVFAISSRVPAPGERPHPPQGVHLPAPSLLPVVMSIGAALLGAGLAFRPDNQLMNWFLGIPGVLVIGYGAVSWVRAAGHEWRDTEGSSHDDAKGH